MLVMFSVGEFLTWMGLLTAVMVHEKTRPLGRRAVPVTGIALLAAASTLGACAIYTAAN
jgi:predicted metal-binding membrane protein